MKPLLFNLSSCLLALFLSACGGPSKAELRAEQAGIEQELMQIEMAANQLRAQVTQAEWQSFFGGFATSFGFFSGDNQTALQGAGVVANAAGNHDLATRNLQQLQVRYNQLAQRWNEIESILQ